MGEVSMTHSWRYNRKEVRGGMQRLPMKMWIYGCGSAGGSRAAAVYEGLGVNLGEGVNVGARGANITLFKMQQWGGARRQASVSCRDDNLCVIVCLSRQLEDLRKTNPPDATRERHAVAGNGLPVDVCISYG